MYGVINKRYKTHEVFENTPGITEVYTDADFSWTANTAVFYIKYTEAFDGSASLLYKLAKIWGFDDIHIYMTKEFDSILLNDRRLIYTGGRWYDE